MKLATIEPLIQTGDVLLMENPSLFGKLINITTFSRFTHAAFAVRTHFGGRLRLCVFESMEGDGVRMKPLDRYLVKLKARGGAMHWFKLNDEKVDRDKLGAFLHTVWDDQYASILQLVLSFGWLIGWIRRRLGATPHDLDPDRFFCSELVSAALQAAGWTPDSCCPSLAAATAPEAVALFPVLHHEGVIEP